MFTTKEIACPKCGAIANAPSTFWASGKPYCAVCGWNLERAKEGERHSLKRLPLSLLWAGLVFGLVFYLPSQKHSSPGIFPFLFIGLIVVGAFMSWRRLRALTELRPTASYPGTSRLVAPVQSPSADDVKTRILHDRLVASGQPRRISLKGSTIFLSLVFVIIIAAVLTATFIAHQNNPPNANPANVFEDVAFFLLFGVIALSMVIGTLRSIIRDRKLLANGDVAIGVVVSQETVGGKSKTSKIKYDFKDAAGRTYTGKSNDETHELYEDMTTLVFYDRDSPARNVALVGSTWNLVDF
jgi:hypothetical protein